MKRIPFVIWIIILTLAMMFICVHNLCLQNQEVKNNIILLDSIEHYRNRLDHEVSKNRVVELQNITQLEILKEQTEEIHRLKDLIKKSKPKKLYTVIDTQTKIDTIIHLDTVLIQTPYQTQFSLENWVNGSLSIHKDTLGIDLSILNKYDVTIGTDKNGTYAEVTNHNPYTSTTLMRAVTITDNRKTKHFHIGPVIGLGLSQNSLQPFIGVGLTYSLFDF